MTRDSLARPRRLGQHGAMIVFINRFTVAPDDQPRLIDILTDVTERFVAPMPGFLGSTLHRGIDGTKVTMVAHWESLAAYEAMRADPEPLPLFQQALALATFEPGTYEVVRDFPPATAR